MTPRNIGRTLSNALGTTPTLIKGLTHGEISPALREKIVLSVASANNSRYCKWGHSQLALANGVSLDDVNAIIKKRPGSLTASHAAEAAAIRFARQYAENFDQVDPVALEKLHGHFTQEQIDEIMAYIYHITMGNLLGNTLDSFLSRFRTHGKNSILLEAAIAAVAAPILGVVALAAAVVPGPKMDELRVPRAYGVDEV